MAFDIDKWMADREKEEAIWCPHCGERYWDEDYNHVLVCGDEYEEFKEATCGKCEKDFGVHETVRRTYETKFLTVLEAS